MIKCLIFDLNDTLDNTNSAIIKAFKKVLKKHLPTLNQNDFQSYAQELMVFFWQSDRLADLSYPNWTMDDIIKHAVEKWYEFKKTTKNIKINVERFSRDYGSIRNDFLTIKPMMVKLIKALPSPLFKFIFSQGNSKSDIINLLHKSSLSENNFTEIISTKLFKEENKPSINILNYILRKYSLKPKECVMIGDDICADLMPAKILGIKTILSSPYVDTMSTTDLQLSTLIKKCLKKIIKNKNAPETNPAIL